MINDRAVGKVKRSYKAGLVSIKLAINDKQENPDLSWDDFDAWKVQPALNKKVKIRCYIF